MPPLNTPQRSPRPQTPQQQQGRPLTPLSYLSSPAPDLASTLYTSQSAAHPEERNISLTQMPHNTLDHASQSQQRRDTPEDLSRLERLQRVLARLNRLHEPATSSPAAYSNRTPSPNQQSLYDWAPAGYEDSREQENELEAILSELRRQQPETHPDILRVLGQSQLDGSRERERGANGVSSENAADSEHRRSVLRERERRRRESEWVNLRSRAVLQRARQEGGASPSATERMLRYVMDRERSGMSEEEERARGSGWFRPSPRYVNGNEEHQTSNSSREGWQLPPPANEARERDRQERVEAFRRGYLAENVPPRIPRVRTPPMSPPTRFTSRSTDSFLERTLKYLSELRACSNYEDALSTAMDHGLATKEFFADKHDDFIMDVDELSPLPYSSWMQPGAVSEGHQYACTFSNSSLTHQGPTPTASRIEQINPNFRSTNSSSTSFDHPPGSTRVVSFDTGRSILTQPQPPLPLSPKENHDQWPVRVIIHSIDPEKMTLQGTMEAYNVPQHPTSLSILNSADRPKAGKKDAPITTYLEGHIIDLRTHSFLTPGSKTEKASPDSRPRRPSSTQRTNTDMTFPPTTPATDAENWLKLSPFPSLSQSTKHTSTTQSSAEDTLSRLLLSTSALQKLQSEYIFMRWKEKCFVHTKDSDCSATYAERQSDQDRGHGLTISGFYYVSLRRSDGAVEGLYFDPMSTPYQCLRLRGVRGVKGAWEFR